MPHHPMGASEKTASADQRCRELQHHQRQSIPSCKMDRCSAGPNNVGLRNGTYRPAHGQSDKSEASNHSSQISSTLRSGVQRWSSNQTKSMGGRLGFNGATAIRHPSDGETMGQHSNIWTSLHSNPSPRQHCPRQRKLTCHMDGSIACTTPTKIARRHCTASTLHNTDSNTNPKRPWSHPTYSASARRHRGHRPRHTSSPTMDTDL